MPYFNCTSPFAPGEEILFPAPYTAVEGATEEEIAAAKKAATILYQGEPLRRKCKRRQGCRQRECKLWSACGLLTSLPPSTNCAIFRSARRTRGGCLPPRG